MYLSKSAITDERVVAMCTACSIWLFLSAWAFSSCLSLRAMDVNARTAPTTITIIVM